MTGGGAEKDIRGLKEAGRGGKKPPKKAPKGGKKVKKRWNV